MNPLMMALSGQTNKQGDLLALQRQMGGPQFGQTRPVAAPGAPGNAGTGYTRDPELNDQAMALQRALGGSNERSMMASSPMASSMGEAWFEPPPDHMRMRGEGSPWYAPERILQLMLSQQRDRQQAPPRRMFLDDDDLNRYPWDE